jgi:hypothetical protein
LSKTACGRKLLSGYDKCFWHSPDTKKYGPQIIKQYFGKAITLKEALETEVANGGSLAGAFLRESQIGGNWFQKGTQLNRADLRAADLSHAHLSYGSLNGANLALANLEFAFLSDVDIRNANFSYAKLHKTKFRSNDFTGVQGLSRNSFHGWKWAFIPVYHILEEYPEQCEGVYRAMVKHFMNSGALDDASWAAYREKIIHHLLLKKDLSITKLRIDLEFENLPKEIGPKQRALITLIRWLQRVLSLALSYLSCFVFGYGEKPLRVIVTMVLTILAYAVFYNHWSALSELGFISALYFSIVTFTTLGYGDILPKAEFRLLAASEAILGVLLIGLFLFVLSRRAIGRG